MKNFFRLPVIIGALPVTLTNGTTADATQVMSDLNWIINQTNANAAPLATTALINANNNFSVVQSGIAATAAAHFPVASQVQNNAFNTLTSTLGTNALTARVAELPLGAFVSGQVFTFIPSQTNTGPSNVTIDSAGSSIIFSNGNTLIGGELVAGNQVSIARDATRLNLLSGGAQALNLIARKTVSNAADLAITTGLDGTFDSYFIELTDIRPSTDAVTLQAQISQDAGANWLAAAGYGFVKLTVSDLAALATAVNAASNTIDMTIANLGSASGRTAVGKLQLWNPGASGNVHKFDWDLTIAFATSTGTIAKAWGSATFTTNNNAYNAIRFFMSSGNISGTAALYGYRR